MTLPTFRTTVTAARLKDSLDRLRKGLETPGKYIERWWADGYPEAIEIKWFENAGPDGKAAPKRFREDWLYRTDRNGPHFWAQVVARHGSGPQIDVEALYPRWVWTKNTLRSTYEPVTFGPRSAHVEPTKLKNRFDADEYNRHGGPFVDVMLNYWDAEPWNVPGWRESLQIQIAKMLVQEFEGDFRPKRYVA